MKLPAPTIRYLFISVLTILFLSGVAMADTGTEVQTAKWIALIPPVIAIGLALLLREVIVSLLFGLFVGTVLLYPSNPGKALISIPTDFLWNALADRGHAAIIIFSLMLGGMVGILSRTGGTIGIVRSFSKLATGRRGGLLMTWLLGLVIFFDDYANTLLVGNTMRPYTDKLRISRAKLAYIVDSTAAPVASIAVISTWVGFEVGLIRDAAGAIEGFGDAYLIFLQSIPYSFYSIFAIVLVFAVAFWGKDFGPMRLAENQAAAGDDRTRQESEWKTSALDEPGPHAVWMAAIPILLVVVITFGGLYLSGKSVSPEAVRLFEILGNADSSAVLLCASFIGMLSAGILAVFLGKQKNSVVSEAINDGIRSMMPAMVILILAWSLGDVCGRLGTAEFIIGAVSGKLVPFMIPAVLFLASAIIAFSTGTSWGTMAILIPLAIPLAHQLPLEAGLSAQIAKSILLGTIGATLAGATFGDHCSPISDTTILSSMASGCDHMSHVSTQLPYALTAGLVAIFVGYLPVGFGISPFFGLIIGIALLFIIPKLIRSPRLVDV